MIGRAYLWGLAANGQAGVENVLDILRGGIDSALLGLRVSSIHELTPEHLVIPDGFHRSLGAASRDAVSSYVVTAPARNGHLAERRRRNRWSWCRSARSSSTARTCRSTPMP